MNWKPGTDMYIGLAMGFIFVLFAAWIMGMPAGSLAIIALIFVVAGVGFVLVLKRVQDRGDRRRRR